MSGVVHRDKAAVDVKKQSDYVFAMEELVAAAQELARARSLQDILDVVRITGRQLAGADGATFVLKDGDKCFYVDESAIGPLWKGLRFPLENCVSGWVMNNNKPVAIEDIYKDHRVPIDAYRPTFVKSMMMVAVGNPAVGAIGNYWSTEHQATEQEISILQSLADTVAVAMENVKYYQKLQDKIKSLESD